MSPSPPDAGRRRVLARSGQTAAAAATLAVLSPAAPASPAGTAPASEAPQHEKRGYRETDRARRYYQLARF
jgi:hypothetical protein